MKISLSMFSAFAASLGMHAAAIASPARGLTDATAAPVLVSQVVPYSAAPVAVAQPPLVQASASALAHGPSMLPSLPSTGFAPASAVATVRVNNLSGLDTAVAIAGPIGEVAFIGVGILLITRGVRMAKTSSIVWGVMSIALGTSLPGCLSWLLSTARDANLCG